MDFKPEINLEDFRELHPNLFVLIGYCSWFAYKNKLPCRVTSLKSDVVMSRSSRSHADSRAIDFSVHGWPLEKIHEFVAKANGMFYDIAALSASDNVPRAVIYHSANSGPHLHLQVKS